MKWSKKEIEFLRKNYSTMRTEDISKRLERSRETIVRKACDLNLKKTESFISELRKSIGAKSGFKKKISRAQKGKKGFWLGRRRSMKTRQKIGMSMKLRFRSMKPVRLAKMKRKIKAIRAKPRAKAKKPRSFWSLLTGK